MERGEGEPDGLYTYGRAEGERARGHSARKIWRERWWTSKSSRRKTGEGRGRAVEGLESGLERSGMFRAAKRRRGGSRQLLQGSVAKADRQGSPSAAAQRCWLGWSGLGEGPPRCCS
ncbi:hypothetical protein Mapa_000935 [Marchantia paleacea]|nr:hypothetical protein Mapa_000935 [Marchantia paleacea]